MTFKQTLFTLLPSAFFILSACQPSETEFQNNDSTYTYIPADIQVNATTDFESSAKIKSATFIPNSFAGWASQLILISDTGSLLRTQMDRPNPVQFEAGPYRDIRGFGRKSKAGALLALTQEGDLHAFIENSDSGDLVRLPLSTPDIDIARFCGTSNFMDPVIYFESTSGKTKALNITVEDDTQLTLEYSEAPTLSNCLDHEIELSQNGTNIGTLSPNPTGSHLVWLSSKGKKIVGIADGLSIRGIQNPELILMTSGNLGSAFSQGAILITDQESNRVVLIAQDYLTSIIQAP